MFNNNERRINPLGQWLTSFAVAMALTNGFLYLFSILQLENPIKKHSTPSSPVELTTPPPITSVASLGRLEPKGEIIRISSPASSEGTRIAQILIKEGDRVKQGQVLAILDSHNRRLASLEKAKADVQIAQARLALVKAGAKTADIQAQKEIIRRLEAELSGQTATQTATIARLQAELRNAEIEFNRFDYLHDQGAISTSEFDTRRLQLDTTQQQLNEANAALSRTKTTIQRQISEAKATLESIAKVRPEDVQIAQAELASTRAIVQQAQAELDLTMIIAPRDGQVLKVHTKPGEIIENEGIAEIGQTEEMYVVAEVYETDINRVKLGQKAIVTSGAFSGQLQGEVAKIDLQVSKQNVFETNPLADTDRRVIEVKIRLNPEDSQKVMGFTNLQVESKILLKKPIQPTNSQ